MGKKFRFYICFNVPYIKNLIPILFTILPCVSTPLLLAQNENEDRVTLTTYYPAPYGIYQNPRLVPSNTYPTTGLGEGLLVYRSTDNAPAYYNNSGSWVVLAAVSDLNQANNLATTANTTATEALETAEAAQQKADEALSIAQNAFDFAQKKCY